MPSVVDKAQTLRNRGYENEIEVDGGINFETVQGLSEVGVDIVVVGSFLMKQSLLKRAEVIAQFQSLS